MKKSEEAAELLAMLANAHRLQILCELEKGEQSVSALTMAVGLSQSALSQHLAKLRAARIVTSRRDGQTIYYSVQDARTLRLLGVLYEEFCTGAATQQGGSRE